MTIDEKMAVINNHCSGRSCGDCVIKKICIPIMGAFRDNQDKLETAYNIITTNKLMENPVADPVHPSHYRQGSIECIDAMVAAFGKETVANFCLVNAFKYVWRNRDKNGLEDIDKAIWYLNKYKELVDNA